MRVDSSTFPITRSAVSVLTKGEETLIVNHFFLPLSSDDASTLYLRSWYFDYFHESATRVLWTYNIIWKKINTDQKSRIAAFNMDVARMSNGDGISTL